MPRNPLMDAEGRVGGVVPATMGPMAAKTGVET